MFYGNEDKIKAYNDLLKTHAENMTDTAERIANDTDALISAFENADWNDAVADDAATVLDRHIRTMNNALAKICGSADKLNKLTDALEEYFLNASRL